MLNYGAPEIFFCLIAVELQKVLDVRGARVDSGCAPILEADLLE